MQFRSLHIRILWNPKVPWHLVYKGTPLIYVVSLVVQSTPLHPVALGFTLMSHSHLRLVLVSSLFPSGFATKIFARVSIRHACCVLDQIRSELNMMKWIEMEQNGTQRHL
jgi:hypothetical protein